MIDKKNARRYDDCLKYTMVAGKKALVMAGLEKERNSEGYKQLDVTRTGVLVGTGMGGLTVFQDGEGGEGRGEGGGRRREGRGRKEGGMRGGQGIRKGNGVRGGGKREGGVSGGAWGNGMRS